MRIWPAKDIDLTWRDWIFAMKACCRKHQGNPRNKIYRALGRQDGILICKTARSAFDLFLRTQEWSNDDEIIFSALTIPDMPRIARDHGLKVVALDICPKTTKWKATDLENLITPRTRALVVTHLYGIRLDLEDTLQIARKHDIAVIEDCAQAYSGPGWLGHEESDISLFSFGPMKMATALQGSIVRVRDERKHCEMAELLQRDPRQRTHEYSLRVLLYGVFKWLSQPVLYGWFVALTQMIRINREALLNHATTNISGKDLFENIRQQPCDAMIEMLAHQLEKGHLPTVTRRTWGTILLNSLENFIQTPHRDVERDVFWLVPVCSQDPRSLMKSLRSAGFDAMPARLAPVPDDARSTPGADKLNQAVFLPLQPLMPLQELVRLCNLVNKHESSYGRITSPKS